MEKLKPVLERLLSLLIMFLVLAGTVASSRQFFGHHFGDGTASADAAESALPSRPTPAQLNALGLDANQKLTLRDSISWKIPAAEGKDGGFILSSQTVARDVNGYAGNTPVFLYVSADSTVRGLAAGDNIETPHFFDEAFAAVREQVVGKRVSALARTDIDGATGATYSSNALTRNVKLVAAAFRASNAAPTSAPAIGWTLTAVIIAVLAFGVWASFAASRLKWLRFVVLVVNVVVTGFWCGQFLSLGLLRGWMQNGADPLLYLPTFLMLALALMMPFLGKSRYYCNWVCPLGAAQELAFRLPIPKFVVPRGVYGLLNVVRIVLFVVLMACLWFGAAASILDYEPFSAFLLSAASWPVLALAVVILALSLFFPRPWCRAACPLGVLLSTATKCPRKPKCLQRSAGETQK